MDNYFRDTHYHMISKTIETICNNHDLELSSCKKIWSLNAKSLAACFVKDIFCFSYLQVG